MPVQVWASEVLAVTKPCGAGGGCGNAPVLPWRSVLLGMSQVWCGTQGFVLSFLVMPQPCHGVLGDAGSGLGLGMFL